MTNIKVWAVAAATAVGIGLFGWTLVHSLWYAPESEVASVNAGVSQSTFAASTSTPVRLLIPSLTVDANVQYVGVNAKGAMAVPTNFTDVAWYKRGTVPGQIGSAVIDGHVDNGLGLAGVFKHLSALKAGDDVYIITKDGSRLHFIVSAVELYPYKSAPSDKIFNQRDAARLNLVTCDGAWVQGDRTYDERLVVYTIFSNT